MQPSHATARVAVRPALFTLLAAFALALLVAGPTASAKPLKVGFSDWPGWMPYEVALQKGFFKEAGVDVEFEWFEYGPSLEAFSAGKIDGVSITNGDALVLGASGKPSTGILINDYSDGNDMIIAKAGIESLKDLKGKKVGLELNLVDHLLLLKGLELNGMQESDVTLVNIPTNETAQALIAGGVDAIGCWHPTSTTALREVAGSKAIFTSKEVPGLIFDCLYVSRESLAENRAEWVKLIEVWYRTLDWIKSNPEEANKIMAARISLSPDTYPTVAKGTYILSAGEVLSYWEKRDDMKSIYGSSTISQDFNMKVGVYKEAQDVASYLDPSLVAEVIAKMKK